MKKKCNNIIMPDRKICTKCKTEKSADQFSKTLYTSTGLKSWCKTCCNNLAKGEQSYKYRIKNRDKLNNKAKERIRKNPYRTWATSTLKTHRKKYIINITIDELIKFINNIANCQICECELDWNVGTKDGKSKLNSPSLDRINNEDIININNIQIICVNCNKTKGSRTMDGFIKYCRTVINKFDPDHHTGCGCDHEYNDPSLKFKKY